MDIINRFVKQVSIDDSHNDYNNIINNLISENEKLKSIVNTSESDIIYNRKNIEIIKTNINTLVNFYKLTNWNKNRPVCETRVDNIVEYYNKKDIGIIPGVINVWYNNNNYYILDGLHRYTAGIKYGKNSTVILHINYNKNENDIIDEFININKSIAIPSIYLEDDNIKKNVCESLVNKISINYPQFISSSRKPFNYNFNRDLLIEFFSNFDIDFTIQNLENKIFDILMTLNDKAKYNVITGKISHPKKCLKYNFYLFFLEKNYIKKEVENTLKLL